MTTFTSVTDTPPTALSYRFGTGAPAGVWLGLGVGRLAVLAAGLLATVTLLALRAALPVGLCPLLMAAGLTLVPVAGRPLSGWVVPGMGHGRSTVTGGAGWTASPPQIPMTDVMSSSRLRLPPECGRIQLAAVTAGRRGLSVGVLVDRSASTGTLVFAVAGCDRFGLLDPDGQDLLLAGWGRALTALAHRDRRPGRVQLLERVSVVEPDTDAAVAWARDRTAGASLGSLGDAMAQVTVNRQSLLAVQLVGLRDPSDAVGHARQVAAELLAAELVARPLDDDEVRTVVGLLIRPGATGVPVELGPVSRRTAWDHVRTDDCWHRSFAVTGWPGSAVPASWLSPLLLVVPPAGAWTLSVHLSSVPPEVATRLARAARAKAELDRADRARLGLAASAAADKAVTESAGMDAELVAGHATHRLAGVLTASAGSAEELDAASRGLTAAAVGAGLTVQPLHGQHHVALAATLPLCRLRFGGAR